jgi:hypothetical protein
MGPVTFLDQIKELLPSFFFPADPFAEYLKHAKRRSEFSPMEDLMTELRQGIALLEAARAFPPTLRTYSQKEVLAGEMGTTVVPKSSSTSDP